MLEKTTTPSRETAQAKRSFDLNQQRRRDIASLVKSRHGKLAKAILCMEYAIAAAWHCPADSERRFLMVQWCRWTCAPWSIERQIDAILEANPPRRISADALARRLHVSDAERTALRIWTIGSFDFPKAKRKKRRKQKRSLHAQARRQGRGAKPREQSFSRTKPWLAAGFRCRSTWERHGKPMPQLPQIRSQTLAANTRPRESSSLPYGYEFASSAVSKPNGTGKSNDHQCQRRGRQEPTPCMSDSVIVLPPPQPFTAMERVEPWQVEAMERLFSSRADEALRL